MSEYKLNLVHFGDNCAPGIIIDDILNTKIKQLFMLGIFTFNDIIMYLQDNDLHSIYDIRYLEKTSNNIAKHTKYNFKFNHDYRYDNDDNIINYNIVKERFIQKINNYNRVFTLNTYNIFITFTDDVNSMNIDQFIELYKNIKFHLIIFTNNNHNIVTNTNVSVIDLQNNYEKWWLMNSNTKKTLYKEIYSKFINVLNNNNINHTFPDV